LPRWLAQVVKRCNSVLKKSAIELGLHIAVGLASLAKKNRSQVNRKHRLKIRPRLPPPATSNIASPEKWSVKQRKLALL